MRFAARKIRKILGNAVAPPIGLLIASASGEETRADIKSLSTKRKERDFVVLCVSLAGRCDQQPIGRSNGIASIFANTSLGREAHWLRSPRRVDAVRGVLPTTHPQGIRKTHVS